MWIDNIAKVRLDRHYQALESSVDNKSHALPPNVGTRNGTAVTGFRQVGCGYNR
jgi:hypothetical protein